MNFTVKDALEAYQMNEQYKNSLIDTLLAAPTRDFIYLVIDDVYLLGVQRGLSIVRDQMLKSKGGDQ